MMEMTVENKMAKLEHKGWKIESFLDTSGNTVLNAKFFKPVGRAGKKKATPLYNVFFRNRNDLLKELYYSSVGTQRELATEFGLTEQEIAYIKNDNKTYVRQNKDGEHIRVKIDAGRMVKCSEDIRFYLSQIEMRPYDIFLRKETVVADKWINKIETICNALSARTDEQFYADFIQRPDGNYQCTVYVNGIFPIYHNDIVDFHETFSYLNNLLLLTDNYNAQPQRDAIGLILSL